MNERQLRYFAAIYEEGAMARAARRARVAVSALSHHLNNLEAELETSLFVRTQKGMQPTAAGRSLYDRATGILKLLSSAADDVRSAAGQVAGDVSVGMAHSAVKVVAIDLLKRVASDFPNVRLSLTESLPNSTLVSALSSEIDLAIVYNPPANPRLKTEAILEERMMCIGRPQVIGDAEEAIAFDEVLELPLIAPRAGPWARILLDDESLLERVETAAKFQLNSVRTTVDAVCAGLGATINTRHYFAEQIRHGTVCARPITDPEITRKLHLCELADQPPSFAIEATRELVTDLIDSAIQEGRWEATALQRLGVEGR